MTTEAKSLPKYSPYMFIVVGMINAGAGECLNIMILLCNKCVQLGIFGQHSVEARLEEARVIIKMG